MANKDLSYYMTLPYTLIVKEMNDESGSYFYGTYAELDGCQSTAASMQELLEDIREAKEGWIAVKLEHGDPVPEPQDSFSGKFVVRVPKSLHQQLAMKADQEGVSLNQFVLYKLSK
ncbi:type II toxin-antitoxin system HicB family antitoxin [Paenibacillaceae bacterium]|nr:type II toxin-antitoxin system HicB family antitoxin [Paenibacillaceae bacterium]